MNSEDVQDAVLGLLSAAEKALSSEEICERAHPPLQLREVRIALRELADEGEALKSASGLWSASLPAAGNDPQHDFTEAELRRARERHGTTSACPRCKKQGNVDSLFGWRRMRRGDGDIQPQSWCHACRSESWRKAT